MKTIKTIFVLLVATLATSSINWAFGQTEAMSYQAYLSSSTTIWERVISQSQTDKFDQAMAQYGFLNATMSARDEAAFEKYYESTVDLLDELIDSGDRVAESSALLSSVYGLSMAYDSWKGMYLGPKSSSLIDKAYQSSPEHPMVVKLYASSKLYTPEMFGGNPSEAAKQFERCVELYEAQGDTLHNWLYLDALAHLGMAYTKIGQTKAAIAVYNKAMALEPDFAWIKFSLLPAAQKAIASK